MNPKLTMPLAFLAALGCGSAAATSATGPAAAPARSARVVETKALELADPTPALADPTPIVFLLQDTAKFEPGGC